MSLVELRKQRDALNTKIRQLERIETEKGWVKGLTSIHISGSSTDCSETPTLIFIAKVNVEKLKAIILEILEKKNNE